MENKGLPKTGLSDERAVLRWVRDCLGLFDGGRCQVSVWGESAGAGSILHDFTAVGRAQDQLLSQAMFEAQRTSFSSIAKDPWSRISNTLPALADCKFKCNAGPILHLDS